MLYIKDCNGASSFTFALMLSASIRSSAVSEIATRRTGLGLARVVRSRSIVGGLMKVEVGNCSGSCGKGVQSSPLTG